MRKRKSPRKSESVELLEAFERIYDQWIDAHERLKIVCGLLELKNYDQAKIMADHLFEKFEAERRDLLRLK
jgi:hypothetical protein